MSSETVQPQPPDLPPPVSRESFDIHWLRDRELVDELPYGFAQTFYDENPGSRSTIEPYLGRAILDHHFHRQRIGDRLRDLGHDEAALFFASELPKSNTTRKGNFGEVLASEHLIQRHGFCMPVFKIRYRDSYDLPMRGEDIVAFALDANNCITRVIIGEAKCIVRFSSATVRKAHDRLQSAYHPRPMTLSMLAEIMYESNRVDLGSEIDRVSIALINSEFPRENWIFLVNQDQPDYAFNTLAGNVDLVPNLHCIGISLPDLTDFVNALFDNPPIPEESEDAS